MKNDFIKNKNIKNQPKKADKKTFSFYALVFALLFMFVGSILGSIAFVRTCNFDSRVNIAYADENEQSYRYVGSNILVPISEFAFNSNNYYSNPYTDKVIFSSFNVSIERRPVRGLYNEDLVLNNAPFVNLGVQFANPYDGDKPCSGVLYYAKNGRVYNMDKPTDYGYPIYNLNQGARGVYSYIYNRIDGQNYDITNVADINDHSILRYTYFGSDSNDVEFFDAWGRYDITVEYGFNCNVAKVVFNSNYNYPADYGTQNAQIFNYIQYVDTNGYKCQIAVTSYRFISSSIKDDPLLVNSFLKSYLLERRDYYILDPSSIQQSIIDEKVAEGVEEIKNGYETTINNLKLDYNNLLNSIPSKEQDAFDRGKIEGVNSANSYTFLSLFSSLFDAPIQALSGLLSFNFLGLDLWVFFRALLTIGLVIFVVRLLL